MRSSSERVRAVEAALLEKIEELSLLRLLNDRLGGVPDFASACRALVELVWECRGAEAVAYVSVDGPRRRGRLEAAAPAGPRPAEATELDLDTPPLGDIVGRVEPVVLDTAVRPGWLGTGRERGGVLIGIPLLARGTTTGVLLVHTAGDAAAVEEERRLLAIVATSAALALDAARSPAREEFLATLRHDIGTPLTVAIGYAEILGERLRAAGEPQSAALAGSVVELLAVIADLVSNSLHMAVIDRGALALVPEEFDLSALAREVVEPMKATAAEKGVSLTCDGVRAPVYADRRQLARVLSNLVSNALKYTPGPGRVDVTTAADAAGATVAVADTGYGISADDQRRLFTKYSRFHQDSGIPGTGLGLYISKGIVEAQGGRLTVASRPGQGSTFTVHLPGAPPLR
jgi:signal transduction histidine kinase